MPIFTRVPDVYWQCKGTAEGYTELNAFDGALLAAGIGDTNLLKISSIVPPACQRVDPIALPFGALVPVAYAAQASSEPGEWIAAAVACAVPHDAKQAGLIMEFHGSGWRAKDAEEHVREMAKQGFLMRNREFKELVSIASEHQVKSKGAAFAAIVLWWSDWADQAAAPPGM